MEASLFSRAFIRSNKALSLGMLESDVLLEPETDHACLTFFVFPLERSSQRTCSKLQVRPALIHDVQEGRLPSHWGSCQHHWLDACYTIGMQAHTQLPLSTLCTCERGTTIFSRMSDRCHYHVLAFVFVPVFVFLPQAQRIC